MGSWFTLYMKGKTRSSVFYKNRTEALKLPHMKMKKKINTWKCLGHTIRSFKVKMYWFKNKPPPSLAEGWPLFACVFCFFDSVGVGLEEDVYLESVANKAHHASAVNLFPVMDLVTLLVNNIRVEISEIYHKRIIHPKIIYSPTCHSKPVIFIHLRNTNDNIFIHPSK